MLRVLLFGSPRIERGGEAIPLRRTRALALLACMALARRPYDRDGLCGLLWPEFDTDSARNNLRRELSLLKSAIGDELLTADRLQVAWNPQAQSWCDVTAFQAWIAAWKQHAHSADQLCDECASALTSAAHINSDDFLAGFYVQDSAAFDEWQFFQREGLRQQLAEALDALGAWHARRDEHAQAIECARRRLALDPLHEPAQRELMERYALAGQQSAALRQYDECARLLDKELGVAPAPETAALFEQIRSRAFARAEEPQTRDQERRDKEMRIVSRPPDLLVAQSLKSPTNTLPQTNGFVGRQRELADILRRLTDPACRLLTLVGPGGIGKTRLAIQAARTLAEAWAGEEAIADGVLFVPLAGVSSVGGLLQALAAAAQFNFYPHIAPQQQLLDYFCDKRMLIVFDNFEQLRDAAGLVGALLGAAPRLRLLVTSREALNIHEEWFHPVDGLSYPAEGQEIASVAQLARYDAVRLFDQHAQRVRGDFALSREREAVVRLCRMVGGMPLAIELAASWLKVLSVQQVVVAIGRGLEILSARDGSLPARHRSIQAVLEESWALLSEDEQQALARLTVFHGGFDAEAAVAVADTTLLVLASLVDKALLRPAPENRFQLHELLRQFAREKLKAAHAEARACRRHSQFYLALLNAWNQVFESGARQAQPSEIDRERENIRAAWEWAAMQGDITALERAIEPVFNFYQNRGYSQEGADAFASAAALIQASSADLQHLNQEPIGVSLRARQGAFCYALGDYAAATRLLEESLRMAQSLALASEQAFALNILGQMAAWTGEYGLANQRLRQVLAIGDRPARAVALEKLAEIVTDQGDYEAAKQLALESLALSRELGRPDWTAHALDRIGFISFCLGEYREAGCYFRESLERFDSTKHMLGRGLALGALGLVEWAGATAHARAYFEQSLAIFRAIGHQQHIAERLIDLSFIASETGDFPQAQRHGEEALAIGRRLGSLFHTAISLCCLGRAAYEQGAWHTSGGYLVEALQISLAAQIPMMGLVALFYAAGLMSKQSDWASMDVPDRVHLKLQAVEQLEITISYPATWHVYRERARDLSQALQRNLPPDQVQAAIARGRQLDWAAAVAALIDRWSHPAPADRPSSVGDRANQLMRDQGAPHAPEQRSAVPWAH
ncbi:MAG TPA: tetratricopeptide repeat protein [Roseiflexaceae bacterium]|nr:tetratricopeptide repeat protein [Roseiflexaceae bacterium]